MDCGDPFLISMADVTIKDIAEATGVSYATVSRTLNSRNGVSPKTREKVLQTAKEMGYKPNIHARSLKTNQTLTIALIVPDISNPFFADIALSVNKTAFAKGYNTILCSTNWDPEVERLQLMHIQEQRVDGIIFKPCDRCTDRYMDIHIPKVMIANLLKTEGLSYIEVDNILGGQKAASHLIACGYRKPAFLGGEIVSNSNADRLFGFQSTFQTFGIEIPDERIHFGPFTIENGYQSAKRQIELSSSPTPDCFLCGNDLIALGAMQYLAEQRIRIPEDFGVVGFDDVYFASLPQIQMTTIAQPRNQMGVLAAEILIRHIESGDNEEEHILLQPELIIRNSTRKPLR